MNKQRGMGILGILMIVVMVVAGVILSMKAIPAYLEFFAVKRAIAALKSEADGGTVKAIKDKFDARATIDDIKSITSSDLEISKEGGAVVVSVEYQKVVPLFANVSLLLDFQTSTQQ